MKRFLTKIGAFMAVVLALGLGYDLVVSHYLKRSTAAQGEYEVWTDIYENKINADIVIYGSSRAWVHFDPRILSARWKAEVYNLGIDGYDFWMQYLRHLEYVKYNPLPKVIIISLDAFSLELKSGMYNANQFLPYMLFNDNMYHYTSKYHGFDRLDYWVPILRYHSKPEVLKYVKQVVDNPDSVYRINGFKEQYQEWNTELELQRRSAAPITTVVDSFVYNTFIQFIELCTAQQIQLVLVYSPEEIEGREYISNRNEMMEMYARIANEYNIPLYNYSDDPLCNDKTYFYNATHLNYKGATIFSNALARDLDSIIKAKMDMPLP